MDAVEIKSELKKFICTELLRDPDYNLADDEALITSGLIDSFSIAQIGVFVETSYGVYLPDNELTVEKVDNLNLIADCIQLYS